MGGEHPEAVVLSPERLHRRALRQIPNANRLVLTARHDQLVLGVEKRGGDVVEVIYAGVDLPSLRLVHPPDLDLPVISGRHDERESRVESREIDAAVVSL